MNLDEWVQKFVDAQVNGESSEDYESWAMLDDFWPDEDESEPAA